MAGLARENVESALKELGRLLEFVREGAAEEDAAEQGDGGNRPLSAAALSGGGWDRSKEEAQRFARIMVRGVAT